MATVQTNLEHFWRGLEAHRSTLVLTIPQIHATALSLGLDRHPNKADSVQFTAVAETIYEAQTQEEMMVQDLLEQWRKGRHGYVPDVKGDNIVRLGCENANSLSLFDPHLTKRRKLLSLNNIYQMDGACIVEHGTNFLMAPVGQRPEDIFAAFRGSRVSAAHNIHEQHSRYQQGGTLTMAFTCLSEYITATGMDLTGLSHWSWVQVGSGEKRTRIVTTYQPCQGSTMPKLGRDGRLLHSGTVATQHTWYFWKRGIFLKPQKLFAMQLVTQLKLWQSAGEEIILFVDMNENIYTGSLGRRLRSDGLLIEEQTLQSTGREAPHSHQSGQAAIVRTFATPGIVCTNSYLSPHGAGIGEHRFQIPDFDAHLVLGTEYPTTVCPSG
jgi:hypothetical protein